MGDSRCVKRLFTVFLGWIVGGTLAFSQLLPTPIYQKATYFSLEDVRLLRPSTEGKGIFALVES